MNSYLNYKAFNAWPLFWLLSGILCVFMGVAMTGTDLGTAEGVSAMIGYSVRWAVPFIFIVVATSALQTLFPGPIPRWLLKNRKYIGLVFAVAMAWQGLFIALMSNFHRDYYYEEVFYLRDELEGSTGYLFLIAMVITSFDFGRRWLNARQWRLLHLCGLYFLWAYPFSVYWWSLFYYRQPDPIDYPFYAAGFAAFALRIAAWGKRRRRRAERAGVASRPSVPMQTLGGSLIALGLLAAVTGAYWQEPVTNFLLTPAWSESLSMWLPFWPFEPFLPLAVLGLGTWCLTRRQVAGVVPAAAAS